MRKNKALAVIILSLFILLLFPFSALAEEVENEPQTETEEVAEEMLPESLPEEDEIISDNEDEINEDENVEDNEDNEEIDLGDIIVDKLREEAEEDETDNIKAGEKISPTETKKYRELPRTGLELNVLYLCGLFAGMLVSLVGAITCFFYGIRIIKIKN